MSEQRANGQPYQVSVYQPAGAGADLVFTFIPKTPQERPERGSVPRFIVTARQYGNCVTFDWSATQDDPKSASTEMEQEALERIRERAAWMQRVNALVDQVEAWAKELNWATRRIEAKIEDSFIGDHHLPALLMQEDTCRVLLEPVGRSTAGAWGVVDLYLLPAYDDIATLYYYNERWNLHYVFPHAAPVASVREAEAAPVTKELFEKVLAEMRQGAT
ncbi:MAG TPA: hypothetical protein VFW87_11085 [Pirellulales bacterium]|nr:hypothetical protein [Pirellulales bacterium]